VREMAKDPTSWQVSSIFSSLFIIPPLFHTQLHRRRWYAAAQTVQHIILSWSLNWWGFISDLSREKSQKGEGLPSQELETLHQQQTLLQSMATAQTQTLHASFALLETCIALSLTSYGVTSDRMVLRSSPNMHYSATPFVCVNAVL
jgi:hypothetical protein